MGNKLVKRRNWENVGLVCRVTQAGTATITDRFPIDDPYPGC